MYKIPEGTLFMGKNLIFLPQCPSTNTAAIQLSQQAGGVDGTVVITDHQASGRGQRGNTWESEPGKNLTFSLIVRPSFLSVRDQFYLNIVVSLAVNAYVSKKIQGTVRVKWPNDILIDDKKVCGILIENQLQGNKFSNAVIGIGLNINQHTFTVPTATSLHICSGNSFVLSDELNDLLRQLERYYFKLRENTLETLVAEYLEVLYGYNESRVFSSNGQEFEGVITGIDETGRLRMQCDGREKLFLSKEIQFKY